MITINIWDDYGRNQPTTAYVESPASPDTQTKILKKVAPYFRKALKQLGSNATAKFSRNKTGQSGKFNTTLNFVRGTNYPFIKLEGLWSGDCERLPQILEGYDLSYKNKPLHFISES